MTDKEFRRLNRADLIEIIYELQQSEKKLRSENEDLKQQIDRITASRADYLAEVLANVNGLFETAQTTRQDAQVLLDEARSAKEEADAYFADIKQKAAKLARITVNQREEMLEKAKEERRQILTSSQTDQ